MQGKLPMHLSRRCGAHTKNKQLCQSAAMINGRCRMHGGLSPGAPRGNQNALKHGFYSPDPIKLRREYPALLRSARVLFAKEGID